MKAPQIIFILLVGWELIQAARHHKEPKTGLEGEHNIWVKLLNVALLSGILAWGGFFVAG